MNLTISTNTVLNFLHSMALSTSNKQWLADAIITCNSDDFDAAQIEVYEPQKRGQQDGTEIRDK